MLIQEIHRIREIMGFKDVKNLLLESVNPIKLKSVVKKLIGLEDETISTFGKSSLIDDLNKFTNDLINNVKLTDGLASKGFGKNIDEISQETLEQYIRNTPELLEIIDDFALSIVNKTYKNEIKSITKLDNILNDAADALLSMGKITNAEQKKIKSLNSIIEKTINTPVLSYNYGVLKTQLYNQKNLLSKLPETKEIIKLKDTIQLKIKQVEAFEIRILDEFPELLNREVSVGDITKQNLIFPNFTPNFTKILNANNMAEYHNTILNAFQRSKKGVKDPFNIISAKGFEGIGIDDFRKFVKGMEKDINAINTYKDNISKRQHIELLDKNEKNFLNYYNKEIEPYLPKNKTVNPGNITNKTQANSNIFPDYGISNSIYDQRRITKETTDALGALGKSLDEAGYKVEDLTINNVKKIGSDGERGIYEVTYPNGVKINFWESSGGGQKSVNLSPRNAHLNAANSKGYFGPIIGTLDTSKYRWGENNNFGSKQWYIKGEGWERGYGSIIIEDTSLWLKYLKDSGKLN